MSAIRQGSTFAKTITFACVHFSVAFGIAYLLTGNATVSGALALLEPMVNTLAYYAHEKAWQKLRSPVRSVRHASAAATAGTR
jgi:uncharacterized membrane protein